MNDTWLATLRSCGHHARTEVRTGIEDHKRSADTLVYDWDKGTMAAHDWVVTHTLRSQGVNATHPDPNWAVTDAEINKLKREGGECEKRGIEFVPLAMDTFGGFGATAARAIGKVANKVRVRSGEQADTSKTQKRIAQNLRFANMKSIANQIVRRCDPPDPLPPPNPRSAEAGPSGRLLENLFSHGFQHQFHRQFLAKPRGTGEPTNTDWGRERPEWLLDDNEYSPTSHTRAPGLPTATYASVCTIPFQQRHRVEQDDEFNLYGPPRTQTLNQPHDKAREEAALLAPLAQATDCITLPQQRLGQMGGQQRTPTGTAPTDTRSRNRPLPTTGTQKANLLQSIGSRTDLAGFIILDPSPGRSWPTHTAQLTTPSCVTTRASSCAA